MIEKLFPPQNQLHDGMTAARIAGYSWPEINDFVSGRMNASAGVGYHPDEIRSYLGLGSPADTEERLRALFLRNVSGDE